MVAGIITYVHSPVKVALGCCAPRLKALPVCSRGPSKDLMLLDSLLARERGVGVPPEMFKVFHNLLGTRDLEVL
jgi:hypothetical protein